MFFLKLAGVWFVITVDGFVLIGSSFIYGNCFETRRWWVDDLGCRGFSHHTICGGRDNCRLMYICKPMPIVSRVKSPLTSSLLVRARIILCFRKNHVRSYHAKPPAQVLPEVPVWVFETANCHPSSPSSSWSGEGTNSRKWVEGTRVRIGIALRAAEFTTSCG